MRAMGKAAALLLGLGLALPTGWALAAPAPAPAAAQQDSARIVTEAQQYLNSVRTLEARFTQIAPNGVITHGTAWLDRPGRMRFQYDPPSPLLLVAGHGMVLFRDSELGQTSSIPTGQTPLGILLADQIRLQGDDLTVTDVRQLPGQAQITLVRSDAPSEGSLTLTFADDPWSLRQWTVIDAQGQRTTVVLSDVKTGVSIDQSLFAPVAPMTLSPNRGGGG
ncbi:MAG TPA: outer membrane lipoprotein carrier protein LolA [Acetobacteraceae bacterium]|nr:outer membrane lipoprotein carrier protein LolA [Acetobacteraceae bacterium]